MASRCSPPYVRHLLGAFRRRELTAAQAAHQLCLGRSRFYELFSDYLHACASHRQDQWLPGLSGGDHVPAWPPEVTRLLRKRLASKPPSSYSFVASEALRLFGFHLDRAQVRRWAMAHGCAHPNPKPRPPASQLRFQRSRIGELWQLDASPHPWFPSSKSLWPMLNMIDDCSRLFVGSKLYERELLLSYLDFLPVAFTENGLPLQIYVDYHSLFAAQNPESLTHLGAALMFYDITFRYAPTPQAKGKIEREHQFWQNRLPAYFAAEQIEDLATANDHINALRQHRNQHEKHRELNQTPQAAWKKAQREKRSALRPKPPCPWWPYVWSQRSSVKVGSDGRVPIGSERIRIALAPGSKAVLCLHPSGHYSVLAHPPNKINKPLILFSNLPR